MLANSRCSHYSSLLVLEFDILAHSLSAHCNSAVLIDQSLKNIYYIH